MGGGRLEALFRVEDTRRFLCGLVTQAENTVTSTCTLDSGDEGAGDIYFTVLEKTVELRPLEALTLLWVRELIFMEEWDMRDGRPLNRLWKEVLEGDYASTDFEKLRETAIAVAADPEIVRREMGNLVSFVRYENGRHPRPRFSIRSLPPTFSLLDTGILSANSDILHACTIHDDWNYRVFFLETGDRYGLFNWMTTA